jgi:hypothetical protein
LNGTYQFLAYADDVNILEDEIDSIKKNTETSKEVGLEINVEKTKIQDYNFACGSVWV